MAATDIEVWILDGTGADVHHCNNGQTLYQDSQSIGYFDIVCGSSGGIPGQAVKISANRENWQVALHGIAILGSSSFIQCSPTSAWWSGLSFDIYADTPVIL